MISTKKQQNKSLIKVISLIAFISLLVVGFFIPRTVKQYYANAKYKYITESNSNYVEGVDINSIIEYEDNFVMGVHYPTTTNKAINQDIKSYIDTTITAFENSAETFFNDPFIKETGTSIRYSLYVDYEVYRSGDIISFKFMNYQYTGGAHGITDIVTKTYDLSTGNSYDLEDFLKDTLSSRRDLSLLAQRQLLKMPDVISASNEEWIKDGLEPVDKNFENFVLTNNAIIFFFEEYQIGPYCMEEASIELSFEDLKYAINVESEIVRKIVDPEYIESILSLEYPRVVDVGSSKVIALTFDDGPHPKYTEQILNELRKRDLVATFFILGNKAPYYDDILVRMVEEGHEIGNHTWSHKDLTSISKKEILQQFQKTQDSVKETLGIYPTLFRPTYGAYSKTMLSAINTPFVLWSLDTLDWKHKNPEIIKNKILSEVKDGDIILMHDIHKTSAEAVALVLDELIERGYKFVTVSQMIEIANETNDGSNPYVYFSKYDTK